MALSGDDIDHDGDPPRAVNRLTPLFIEIRCRSTDRLFLHAGESAEPCAGGLRPLLVLMLMRS
jgi:hypothetical protein